jgi:hypothetical protein
MSLDEQKVRIVTEHINLKFEITCCEYIFYICGFCALSSKTFLFRYLLPLSL